ncbi:MAG: hypothetical protein EA398_01415 [Deltaproteobacteria bacterium]|nr:MAG: hypothetical protein EA398_01415 [Deltaproteobacteria bacterium]
MRAETNRWLERWSERVREIVDQGWYRHPQRALARVLVEEMSFRGDREDYHRPENSHLSSVVRRRKGLPILLSAVWCIVGRSAQLEVEGIGLPGHFVVRVDGALVDPFCGGRPLDVDGCRAIVARLSQGNLDWSDSFLAPVGTGRFAERVLRNLVGSYLRAGDALRIYRTLRLLTTLDPERLDFQLQRARIAEELGSIGEATGIFRGLAEQSRCRRTAAVASKCLESLRERSPLVN